MKDYYSILGVSSTASQREIRDRVHSLVRMWNEAALSDPGLRARAHREIGEIGAAYKVLGDVQRRQAYDAQYARRKQEQRRSQDHRSGADTPPPPLNQERNRGDVTALKMA